MKFYGKITAYRYAEDNWNPETTQIYAERFKAKSIQSAKAQLTKIANGQVLFSWVQSWDNETQEYTGIHRQGPALDTLEFRHDLHTGQRC